MKLPKKQVQSILRACRKCGLDVQKKYAGFYEVFSQGECVFRAMVGSKDYLCQVSKNLMIVMEDGKCLGAFPYVKKDYKFQTPQ